MSLVKGNNVVVYTFIGGLWKMFACARTATLSINTSMIEISTAGAGDFAAFLPQKHSFTGSIDGLINLDNTNLRLSDFRALQLSKQSLLMRFERTSVTGLVYSSEAKFYITNSTDSASYADVATFAIELQGTGAITEIFTPLPTPILVAKMTRLEYTAIGGETSFTSSVLVGKDVLEVVTDGIGNCKLILTGTPINKEAKFDATTGTITWAIPQEPNQETYVLYQ